MASQNPVGAVSVGISPPAVVLNNSVDNTLSEGRPALWKDYLVLTKPRVISLLLFTTLTAMIIAKGQWPGWWPFLATALGFYMAAGSAHAINMIIDRDIDLRMERTANRPVAAGRISVRDAGIFATILGVGAFALLWFATKPLAAWMAFAGLAFYVVVYTLLLKRRTWSNIVIGGAAGSFPPLVGWAAVTGDLSPLAWCLFAIIFLWTPVHFWALALMIKDDYADAGVPMLPVVRGNHATAVQIGWYTVSTVAISLLPMLMRESGQTATVGLFYIVSAVVLNAVLVVRSVQLYRVNDRPHASKLFHYSMLYLALLFLAMAIDRAYML